MMKRWVCAAILLVTLWPVWVMADTATLTWTQNTDADLQGYKIYRFAGATCPVGPLAGPAIATVGKVGTYADATVTDFDGTLCYEITAIDTAGNESLHSNRATKTVNIIPPVA